MVTAHKISDLNPVNSKLMQIPPKNWSFLYPDANFSIPKMKSLQGLNTTPPAPWWAPTVVELARQMSLVSGLSREASASM